MLGVILPASLAEMEVNIRYSDADGREYAEHVSISAASYAEWFHNGAIGGVSFKDIEQSR